MFKSIVLALFVLFFLSSCSKESSEPKNAGTEKKVYSVEDLMSDSFEYKAGLVTVKGLCVHVCAHSGKKMFLTGANPDNKIIIFTSDDISAFDKKYEGSTLEVTGTLEEEKIDMNYLKVWESELAEEQKADSAACKFESNMKKIDDFKDRISKSKKGYVSNYSMTGVEVKSI
jgi:hypothetical protein